MISDLRTPGENNQGALADIEVRAATRAGGTCSRQGATEPA
jgi:hypothetical protein